MTASVPLPPEQLPLGDGTIVVRQPRPADAVTLTAYQTDDGGWLSARTDPIDDPAGLIDEYLAGWRGEANRLGLSLVIADALTERLVGVVHLSVEVDGLWVSYGVAPDHRERTIATRALRLICDWAFDNSRYDRVLLEIATDNHPSQRVAHKLGFTPTRRERTTIPATGQPYEYWTYERTPNG